jgi:hypothetical protein
MFATPLRTVKARDRGLTASQIRERAVKLGDGEMVQALRAEMMWHGDRSGFADASETIAACDRTLAEIGRGNEAEHNRALVEIAEGREAREAVAEFAAKSVHGLAKPGVDRLKLAYATGEGRVNKEAE